MTKNLLQEIKCIFGLHRYGSWIGEYHGFYQMIWIRKCAYCEKIEAQDTNPREK